MTIAPPLGGFCMVEGNNFEVLALIIIMNENKTLTK